MKPGGSRRWRERQIWGPSLANWEQNQVWIQFPLYSNWQWLGTHLYSRPALKHDHPFAQQLSDRLEVRQLPTRRASRPLSPPLSRRWDCWCSEMGCYLSWVSLWHGQEAPAPAGLTQANGGHQSTLSPPPQAFRSPLGSLHRATPAGLWAVCGHSGSNAMLPSPLSLQREPISPMTFSVFLRTVKVTCAKCVQLKGDPWCRFSGGGSF